MEQSGYDEISIRDIANVLRKRWKFILLPSVIVAIIVFVVITFILREYEAYALIKVGSIGGQPVESIEATSKIMKTQLFIDVIAKNVTDGTSNDNQAIKKTAGRIKYSDVGGLLEVRASAALPDQAVQVVNTAVQVIQIRHQQILNKAQEDLDKTVKYLGERTRSVNILSSIRDFRLEPTRIEIPTESDGKVKSKRNIAALVAFAVVLMSTTMIAFYLEEGK